MRDPVHMYCLFVPCSSSHGPAVPAMNSATSLSLTQYVLCTKLSALHVLPYSDPQKYHCPRFTHEEIEAQKSSLSILFKVYLPKEVAHQK